MEIINKLQKRLLKKLRSIYSESNQKTALLKTTIDDDNVSKHIKELLQSPNSLMIARFGSTEFACLVYIYVLNSWFFKRWILYVLGVIDNYKNDSKIESSLISQLCNWSGFFPNNRSYLKDFYNLMMNDLEEVDVLGIWLNEHIFKDKLNKKQLVNLHTLEPYYDSNPWTEALKGKKILVIHPFSQTIEEQYLKREVLFNDQRILPKFELKTIKAIQTIADSKSNFDNWFEALNYMKNQISNCDFEIAIIGCGAYGFPLAAHVKRMGKKAIHLGGATQVLFGIKGKRWESLPAVSKLFNESWVRPKEEERPKGAEIVEGGCYW